ncbi:MAG TPA: mannosyltransferase family protein, partial [Catenuloplanes sp.]
MDSPTAPAGTDPGSPATPPPLWQTAGGWSGVGVVLTLFAITRIWQLALISWLTPADGPRLRAQLLEWDATWFVRVATEGYPAGYSYNASGELIGNGLAFFPLYPMLIRVVAATGLSPGAAALVVAWLAAACAAVALHLLGTSLYGRRAGYALVVLCCAQPMSVVLSMGYSEGLFLAVVAGMFVAAHRGHWPVAGLLGLAAALTRPTGVAAALALALAALLAVRRAGLRERWPALAAAVVALAGAPAYLLWAGSRLGRWDGWFVMQSAGWGTSFDGGATTGRFLATTLRTGDGWVPVSVALLLIVAVVAAGIALAGRPWAPLAVYGMIALTLVVGQGGYYHSKPRLLVPVLLIL